VVSNQVDLCHWAMEQRDLDVVLIWVYIPIRTLQSGALVGCMETELACLHVCGQRKWGTSLIMCYCCAHDVFDISLTSMVGQLNSCYASFHTPSGTLLRHSLIRLVSRPPHIMGTLHAFSLATYHGDAACLLPRHISWGRCMPSPSPHIMGTLHAFSLATYPDMFTHGRLGEALPSESTTPDKNNAPVGVGG
jgi:hypothetical protein